MTARRDPEGRRRAIVEAAVEVVAQVGVERVTHRLIAAEAGVPLGSTTYYFPTLRDLVAEAVDEVARLWREDLRAWAQALEGAPDPAAALAGLTTRFLADRRRARRDYELYLLAAREPGLRTAAQAWVDGLREVLEPVAGAHAGAWSALVDGAMLQALVTGHEVDEASVAEALRALARA